MKDNVLRKWRFMGVVNTVYLFESVGIVPQVEFDKKQEHLAGFGCTCVTTSPQFVNILFYQFRILILVVFKKNHILLQFDIPDKMKLFRTLTLFPACPIWVWMHHRPKRASKKRQTCKNAGQM